MVTLLWKPEIPLVDGLEGVFFFFYFYISYILSLPVQMCIFEMPPRVPILCEIKEKKNLSC